MTEYLSYAQALRVVGQDLDSLGVNSFELAKWGDNYIIWLEAGELAQKSSANERFLSRFTRKILGHNRPIDQVPTRLYFTPPDLVLLDTQRQAKRQGSNGSSERRDLSFALRVLGGYLDRKHAREFTISWLQGSATINYDRKRERFSSQHLYDFGVGMYLNRSGREQLVSL